jgi:hypothetical protein
MNNQIVTENLSESLSKFLFSEFAISNNTYNFSFAFAGWALLIVILVIVLKK